MSAARRTRRRVLIALVLLVLGVATPVGALDTVAPLATDNYWVLETTAGRVVVALRDDVAPNSVRQMKRLIAAGVYDGTRFARIVPAFVVQVGQVDAASDRLTPLNAAQSDLLVDMPLEKSAALLHRRGAVSLAHPDGNEDGARSSFSFVLNDSPHLDNHYTAFGEVVVGQDVIDAIELVPLSSERPISDVVITSSTLSGTVPPATGVTASFTASLPAAGSEVTLWVGPSPITIRFYDDSAPQHATLIRRLLSSGQYNASSVGRIDTNYVQVFPFNTPLATPLAIEGRRSHRRGMITMSDVESSGPTPTGFTIVLVDNPALDANYVPFGEVTSGLEQLDVLAQQTSTNDDKQPRRAIGISTGGPVVIATPPSTRWSLASWILVSLGITAAIGSIVIAQLGHRRIGIAVASLGVCCAAQAAWMIVPTYQSRLASSVLFVGSIGVFRLMSKFEAPAKRATAKAPADRSVVPRGALGLLAFISGATVPQPAHQLDSTGGADGESEGDEEGLGVVVAERLPADVTQ
jgi:cyclophilin family peptidyl-prolyl cis-trans isomerase